MSFVGEDTPVGGKERERGDRGLGGGGGGGGGGLRGTERGRLNYIYTRMYLNLMQD